jgi:hypothetical protein
MSFGCSLFSRSSTMSLELLGVGVDAFTDAILFTGAYR